MAIDPRQLGPTQLCRLLNSTPLGEVISERQLHRHRTRAGFRIGEGRTVDLFRYIGWLVAQRHAPKPDPEGLTGYDAMKEQARAPMRCSPFRAATSVIRTRSAISCPS